MRGLLLVKKKKNKANQLKVNKFKIGRDYFKIVHILKCDIVKLKMDLRARKEETIWPDRTWGNWHGCGKG